PLPERCCGPTRPRRSPASTRRWCCSASACARMKHAPPSTLSSAVNSRSCLMSLKGKTLFITGASRGIGLAVGLRAAQDGANIVIAAKTAEAHPKLEGTIYTAAEGIEKAGGKALPLVVDVRDEQAVTAALAKA